LPERRPLHRPIGWRPWSDTKAALDGARSTHTRAYGHRWRKLRLAYLATHPLCECGCGYAATVVDHRVPHLGDPVLMYAWDNLQAMTKACHDRKTAGRDGGFGNARRGTPYPPENQKPVGFLTASPKDFFPGGNERI
jgi:hypothetical protein